MEDRYNLFLAVDKEAGGTYWHRLGSAFPAKNGNGWQLSFNSLPIPNSKGKVIVHMYKDNPRPEDNAKREANDLDDDIPF